MISTALIGWRSENGASKDQCIPYKANGTWIMVSRENHITTGNGSSVKKQLDRFQYKSVRHNKMEGETVYYYVYRVDKNWGE